MLQSQVLDKYPNNFCSRGYAQFGEQNGNLHDLSTKPSLFIFFLRKILGVLVQHFKNINSCLNTFFTFLSLTKHLLFFFLKKI